MDQDYLVEAVRRKREEQEAAEQAQEQAEKQFTIDQFRSVAKAVADATEVLVRFLPTIEPKVEVKNFPKQIDTSKEVVKAVKGLEKTLKPQKVDNKDVIKAITDLSAAIKAMPGHMPRTEAVSVTNIGEVAQTLVEGQKKLTEALNKLELSPKITVPKPTVTVQPTDTKGIIKALKDVKKEIVDKPVPGTPTFVQDPLIRFTPVNMDDDTSVQYYSYIATDGEFYIRKVDGSGAYKTIRFYFGKGAAAHDTAWTGRAGLTYTMWAA